MAVATDYTATLYAADGQPDNAWNGMTTAGRPVIVSYSFVETPDLAEWEAGSCLANDGYSSLTAAQRPISVMHWRCANRPPASALSRWPAARP